LSLKTNGTCLMLKGDTTTIRTCHLVVRNCSHAVACP
jgi:hypothetical protein